MGLLYQAVRPFSYNAVMATTHFHYGNIYSRHNIEDAITLQHIVQIEEGQEIELPNGPLINEEVRKQIEITLGFNVSIVPIVYPFGTYVDFFQIEDTNQETSTVFDHDMQLNENIRSLWRTYQERLMQAINTGVQLEEARSDGHVSTNYPPMNELEAEFRKLAEKDNDLLVEVINKSNDPTQRQAAIYILHWHPDKPMVKSVLIQGLVTDPDHGVHNNAARALLAVTNKVALDPKEINYVKDLIFHPSTACINKGVSLMAQLAKSGINLNLSNNEAQRIEKLKSVKQPNIKAFV